MVNGQVCCEKYFIHMLQAENISRSYALQVCEKPAVDTSASDATCGVQGPVTKIVGGATADKYKYTWLAMLVR